MANANGNPNLRPGPGRKRPEATTPAGILIDRLLSERDWSLRKLAAEVEYPYQRIQAYLKGTRNPSPETLSRLLAPFGLKAEVVPAVVQIKEIGTDRFVQNLEQREESLSEYHGNDT